jgi:hypothetical protein
LAGNISSNVFTLVRSDSYRLAITSPAPFGTYANGQAQVVSGYVSAFKNEGLPTQTNVVSVTVNGVGTTLGSIDSYGNRSFTTTNTVPVSANGSPTPLNVTVEWADGTGDPKLGELEGYYVTAKEASYREHASAEVTYADNADCFPYPKRIADILTLDSFTGPFGGDINSIEINQEVDHLWDCVGNETVRYYGDGWRRCRRGRGVGGNQAAAVSDLFGQCIALRNLV